MTKKLVRKSVKSNARKITKPSVVQVQRPSTPLIYCQVDTENHSAEMAQSSWENILQNRDQIANQALGGKRPIIQTKLTLGPASDKYEQEADAVAKQVVEKLPIASGSVTQRQEEDDMIGRCVQCQEEEDVRAKGEEDTLAGGLLSQSLEHQIQSARGSGRPMADNVRSPMEQAFDTDFSQVKVHTSSQADSLNQSLQAKAFTTGQDIFFRQGEYAPETSTGQQLLAHELTHVVQQRGTAVQRQSAQAISSVSPGLAVQRDVDPKVERALLTAAERDPDILRVTPIPNILDTLRGKGNDGKDIIPLKMQREITHLWSKGQKKRRGDDQELTTRLDYARATLIKVFMEEYVGEVMQNGDRKAARKSASKLAMTLRKEMLAWGLAKAGTIRPELNFLLTAANAPMGEDTAVNTGPRIEIRGTTIPGGSLPGKWHSFVVYTDSLGRQSYIASHMAGSGDNEGLLQAAVGEYRPGIHEWAPDADTKVLEEGPTADDKWPLLVTAAQQINAAQLPYELLSVNCNRAAYHILTQAGVASVRPPAAGYPGWGKMLF